LDEHGERKCRLAWAWSEFLKRNERDPGDKEHKQHYESSESQSDPILVGGITLLKPALQLMTSYLLVIQEVTGAEVLTSYTRWLPELG